MIALSLNKYVWDNLQLDIDLNLRYDKYRNLYGDDFMPFFPVADNFSGDISWGSEPYILYDSMYVKPIRQVFLEHREQILYTLVATIPDLFEVRNKIVYMFDNWVETQFNDGVYRINDIYVWQPDQTRGRDKLRQNYSTTLLFDVNYHLC